MKIIDCDLPGVENPAQLSICLGNLDGLHRGHQRMIESSIDYCKNHPLISSVFLFKDHSKRQIEKKVKRQLTSLDDKVRLLDQMGVDLVFTKAFDQAFMEMDKRSFVRDFLVGRLHTRHIVIGKDYSFGKMAEGRVKDLRDWQKTYGYSLEEVPDVLYGKERISSTRIREAVLGGEVEKARAMLGYPYVIWGEVRAGAKRGRLLGFPTANLFLEFPYVLPREGVYLSQMTARGRAYYGMTDIGKNPTFGGDRVKVETHLFDFSEDLYGERVSLSFLRFARGEVKFERVEDLVHQLQMDDRLLRAWAREEQKKGQEILSPLP